MSVGGDRVQEFRDEGNNITAVPFPITLATPPDLQVTDIVAPERATIGETITFDYTVSNLGTGPTAPRQSSWRDLVYLSRDDFLDLQADRFLGQIERNEGLAAVGQGEDTYTQSITVKIPNDVVSANQQDSFRLFVVTDPSRGGSRGQVFEGDAERNNESFRSIVVEVPPPADLKVVADGIQIPGQAVSGEVTSIEWQVINDSTEPARGPWSDAIYLSEDAIWDVNDRLLGRQVFDGTLGAGETYATPQSIEGQFPPAIPSEYYVIVRTDILNDVFEGPEGEPNNRQTSSTRMSVTVEELQVGIQSREMTLKPGQDRLLQITNVEPGRTLRVQLDSDGELATNELFLRHEDLPSATAFDAAYDGPLAGSQTAVIPSTEPGTYYVLLRWFAQGLERLQDDEISISLLADYLPLTVDDVFVDAGGDSRHVTATIEGAQFHQDAIVKLVRPGIAEYEPVDWRVIDSNHPKDDLTGNERGNRIIATFDLQDAPHGLYDLQVINPDDDATLPYRFLVERAIEPEVTIGIGGPRAILAGDQATYSVTLKNLSNVDAPYVDFEFGVPELGINQAIYGLPYLEFSSNLAGGPPESDLDDVSWATLDSAVNTTGQILAPGTLFDLHAGDFSGLSFNVQTYPGLREMHDRNWEEFRDRIYGLFPELREDGILDEGPAGLDILLAETGILERLPEDLQDFSLTELWNNYAAIPQACLTPLIPFRFHVVAAATALTRQEFISRQTEEARKLRQAILDDPDLSDPTRNLDSSSATLLVLAADEDIWIEMYLSAVEEAGLLRPDDETPPILQNPRITSLMAILGSGLLLESSGEQFRTSESLARFFSQIHRWYGDSPGTIAELEYLDLRKSGPFPAPCPFEYEIPVPALPQFEDYDLGLSSPTHFEAFTIFAPWIPFEDRGAGLPADFQINGPEPVDGENDTQPLDFSQFLEGDANVGRLAAITGPIHPDGNGFLPVGQRLPYIVSFENDENAVRTAGEIRIVTELDDSLDPRSFRLGNMKIGDINVRVPDDRALFQGEMNDQDFVDAKGFILRVSAGIDPSPASGKPTATWLLQAIDPNTGEVIQDAQKGLLPPNAEGAIGEGFVSYTVLPSSNAETNDEIHAKARVLFNTAPPEDTTTLTHVLDATAPNTDLQVTRLGVDSNDFQLEWSATDDNGGSGVRHVTVYVAEDGGDFRILLRQTTETSHFFEGAPNKTYEFLALATDNAGNREQPPMGIHATDDGSRVNLGSVPTVEETTPPNFGEPPEPMPAPSTNVVFRQTFNERIPSPNSTVRPSEYDTVLRPFRGRSFATGIPQSNADIGPLAILELPDESILVSGGQSRNELFRVTRDGGAAGDAIATLSHPIFDMEVGSDGRVWAVTGGGPLLELDPATGEIVAEHGDGATQALAIHPETGMLYVSSGNGIELFDPQTEQFTHYSRDVGLRVGSLAFDNKGELWGTTWPNRGDVVRFNQNARAETLLRLDSQVDSIDFGAADTDLHGLLFVTSNDGVLTMVDTVTLQQVELASGRSRGDIVRTTSDGRVLVSQSHQVDVLSPLLAPPRVVATNPQTDAVVPLPWASVTVTFDQGNVCRGFER